MYFINDGKILSFFLFNRFSNLSGFDPKCHLVRKKKKKKES